MNTNQLKKFAQEARRELLKQVTNRLDFVLKGDTPELREKAEQVQKLKKALDEQGREQLVDKVAYTWFNRLVALRFMDVNDYQPLGIRVITPQDGFTIPELLQEARQGHIPSELPSNKDRVSKLISGSIPSSDPQNEAYRLLFLAACNHLNSVFPFLFESINDWMELLLPDDLISELSVLELVRNGMTIEDCKEVEIIGWLYQFYISEKKDAVFAAKGKVKKEDIPAVTQLFTPRWIVEYMVQNTLGKLWLQNRPNSKLREHMPYFIESPSMESNDYLKVDSVEEIKLLDQACGSGHILVYAFDLFWKIYEEEGYNSSEIAKLIIERNLYGFEIDERAAQLSSLAILMEARSKSRRLFKKEDVPEPNILQFKDLKLNSDEIKSVLTAIDFKATDALKYDLETNTQATNLGSLIQPHSSASELNELMNRLDQSRKTSDVFLKHDIEVLKGVVGQLQSLSQKFHCVVANPPYMGAGKMNPGLSKYVKQHYPLSKSDSFACFIEQSINLNCSKGFSGLVTMESWMFLSSYEGLRGKLLSETTIHSLSHFGWHVMRIAFGTVAFVLQKSKPTNDFFGTYSYTELKNINRERERPKTFPVLDNGRFNKLNQKEFDKIPGSPLGYWLSRKSFDTFSENTIIEKIANPRQGLASSDVSRFIRYWFEVDGTNIDYNSESREEAKQSGCKWFPHNKGGGIRKWHGNNFYVVNWHNDGEEILAYASSLYGSPTRTIKNINHYFHKSVTWGMIGAGMYSCRISRGGFIFDVGGPSAFCDEDNLEIVAGFLNSKLASHFLKAINPTLNYNSGDLGRLPFKTLGKEQAEVIIELVKKCEAISKSEFDQHEYSWNFTGNPLLKRDEALVSIALDRTIDDFKSDLIALKDAEEQLNQKFNSFYNLEDEVENIVEVKELTVYDEELLIPNDIKFNRSNIIEQFIQYSVGCCFGRFSIDVDGLVIDSHLQNLRFYHDYLKNNGVTQATFEPDDDNIIPVLGDEWFKDDITGRFQEFLKVNFAEDELSKNLSFVEDCIGKDIRTYFLKSFYDDHVKRYKKRPIYWMFSSEKGAFNVLIYMHRYTPDTLNIILNDYLRPFIDKLKNRVSQLEHIEQTGEGKEKTRAIKEMDKLKLQIKECEEYEREVLYPLASKRIEIDLDDGVLVNYNKFGKAVKEVSGLNDKATKKKVREFDWIDGTQII